MYECSISKEKAAEFFKSEGFISAPLLTCLVVSRDGKKLGWYYRGLGNKALSLKHHEYEFIPELPAEFKIVTPGSVFMFEGKLHQYCGNTPTKQFFQGSTINMIRVFAEVLELQIVKELKASRKPYHCYKVIERKTGQLVNCLWGAGDPLKLEHFVVIFQKFTFEYNPKKYRLEKLNHDDEFKFDQKLWMLHTHMGIPCIRELDLDLRSRVAERRQGRSKSLA